MSILDLEVTLTDEELNEIVRIMEQHVTAGGSGYGGSDWGWEYDDWDTDVPNREDTSKCGHVWVPVLLINSTVYHCKHCGMKKEDYEKAKTSR